MVLKLLKRGKMIAPLAKRAIKMAGGVAKSGKKIIGTGVKTTKGFSRIVGGGRRIATSKPVSEGVAKGASRFAKLSMTGGGVAVVGAGLGYAGTKILDPVQRIRFQTGNDYANREYIKALQDEEDLAGKKAARESQERQDYLNYLNQAKNYGLDFPVNPYDPSFVEGSGLLSPSASSEAAKDKPKSFVPEIATLGLVAAGVAAILIFGKKKK